MRNFIQLNVNYTLAKSIGLAGASNSDNQLRIRIPEYHDLNIARIDFDRRHALHTTNIVELPFGQHQELERLHRNHWHRGTTRPRSVRSVLGCGLASEREEVSHRTGYDRGP